MIARPNNNYALGGWYENSVRVSGASTTYTFAATTNRALEARFTYPGGSSDIGNNGGSGSGIVINDQIPTTATTDAAIITEITPPARRLPELPDILM